MNNKLITLVITLVVGVILTGSILIPALNDAEHSGAESHSNGTLYMSEARDTTEMILTANNVIYTNGVEITGTYFPAIVSDTFMAAVTNNGLNIFWYADNTTSWSPIGGANLSIDTSTKTISVTEITLISSSTLEETSLTVPYNYECYVRTTNGDYAAVAYSNLSTIKVESGDQIRAMAQNNTYGYFWWNNTEVTINGEVSATEGVVTLQDSTPEGFKTVSAVSYNGLPANYLIVPAKIWTDGVLDGGMLSLLHAIPILVIVALVLMAAGAIILRRD